MRKKKGIVLLLVMAMSLSMLAGCGNKDNKPSEPVSNSSENNVSAVPDSTPGDSEKTDAVDGPSWKQDTSDCTITWFMAYDWYGKKFDEVNNLFDKKLYEETGVKIDIQTGDTDKLNMLIKTGKLPDIITLDANSTQRKLLEDNKMVQPLGPLMEEYAPDLLVPQSMIDWYTAKDGN